MLRFRSKKRRQASDNCTACDGRRTSRPSSVPPVTCKPCTGTGKRSTTAGFFQAVAACRDCNGQGSTVADPCGTCKGMGKCETRASKSINVPLGTSLPETLRLVGEGSLKQDGSRGDLVVHLVKKSDTNDPRGRNEIENSEAIPFAKIKKRDARVKEIAVAVGLIILLATIAMLAR
jgi:DnaJ-class molecular chaperone